MVGGKAQAEPLTETTNVSLLEELKPKQKPPADSDTQVKKYTVKTGDTLARIASEHHTTWLRLFYKNKAVKHPDVIKVGQRLVIPAKNEKLASRKLPANHSNNAVKAPTSNIPQSNKDGLIGSIGYATCGGNCVNEPGVNNPFDGTNPISWAVLSQTPTIGATALWTYNHTGVVVGIWSNGDIEVRHQNFCGGQHRFSRSDFRGFR